jgi:UDP:flavonoid glycosyltransferase YjiC (YdhE family)
MPLLRHRTNSRDFAPEETPSGLIIRNPDGTVQYPAQIPPGVEFDVTSPGGTPQGTVRTTSTTNAPQLPAVKEETRGSAEAPRPKISRQWMTERPQPRSHPSVIPHLRRQGTNASALNQALWNNPYQHDDDSSSTSSSSSSSEDDEPVKPKKGAAAPPKRPAADAGRKGRGSQTSKASGAQVKDRHKYSRFAIGNEDFRTKGKVDRKDGRLNISVNETSNTGYLAKALGAGFLKHIGQTPATNAAAEDELVSPVTSPRGTFSRKSSDSQTGRKVPRPTLNIVVMVIGSRGDIQPFLRLGKILKEEHGHRVRIATHPAFRDFVQKDSDLEFFSVGGDPAELMAFMVKNPGMIPKMETVKAGEIGRRREQMSEMFEGFWRACINATDDEHDLHNLKMMGEMSPFVADAIIANPPCFAHIHCAERLGVPLHLMFTFPYTPTQAFPHPLANIKKTNVDPGYTNFMSYPLVEMMTWQGLGDLVNRFRVKTLGLEPVSTLWAPGQLYRLKVPYTYLWSPGLVPKPEDWGPEIDIAGFVFLDLASSFKPPKELTNFLDAGEPPVYIGFGSIVVDDPDKFTQMIFEAVKLAGVRALVSKGWGGLGGDSVPDGVYMLGNTPHDWLFPKVKAVVHHGGAGTTAIGLKCGKPSMIIPFFGDQQFWGNMMGRSGAGPDPVPYKNLTAEKLAEGIKYLLTDEAAEAAQKIARDIEREGDGAQNAVRSFHRSLNLRGEHSLRCSILEDRVAVWTMKNTSLRLSALAADILVAQRKLHWRQLRLVRHCEWNDFEGPGEPVTGMASAMFGSLAGIAGGIGSVPFRIHRSRKRRERHEEKKQRKLRQKQEKEDQKKSRSGKGAILAGKKEGVEVKDKAQPELKLETNGNGPNGSAKPNGAAKQSHGAATAPAKSNDKATAGPDLGKHTTVGSPIQEHNDRNHEPRDDETDGGDSILSADPEEDVAEVVAQDVGQGLAKSGEALLRGTSPVIPTPSPSCRLIFPNPVNL